VLGTFGREAQTDNAVTTDGGLAQTLFIATWVTLKRSFSVDA